MSTPSESVRLPLVLRVAIAAARAGGATDDDIAARIRTLGDAPCHPTPAPDESCPTAGGGDVLRGAADPDDDEARAAIADQLEADAAAATWIRALGERPEGRVGRLVAETLRTLAFDSAKEFRKGEKPAAPVEIARLALALNRIESAGKLSAERERAVARAAAAESEARAAARAGTAAHRAGLSPETVAAIRRAVQGETPPPCPEQGPFGSMTPAAPGA